LFIENYEELKDISKEEKKSVLELCKKKWNIEDQAVLFGQTKKSFKISRVQEYLDNEKIEEIKKYVQKYFIKLSNTTQSLFWIPGEMKYELLEDNIVKSRYFTKDLQIFVNKKKWSVADWYFSATNIGYRPCMRSKRTKIIKRLFKRYSRKSKKSLGSFKYCLVFKKERFKTKS